jgi:hypothetical protein
VTDLPEPLVPAEVDLRDFSQMFMDIDRVLKSETWMLGTSDEKAASVTLWWESWHQVPAGSLPSNDRVLSKLSGAEQWRKSREMVLKNWQPCSDGRLYHPVVAEKALEAWLEKLAAAISGAEGNAKRWGVKVDTGRMRTQFLAAVDTLRRLAPASKALKKKVVVLIGSQSPPDVASQSPPDASKASPPDRYREGEGEGEGLEKKSPTETAGAPLRDAPPTVPPAKGLAQEPAPPPDFDGNNAAVLNGKAVVAIASGFDLPEQWGMDAEALGFAPREVLREGEKFRQYWVAGKGKGKRRSVKGWRQAWSNWLARASEDRR